MTYTTGSSVKYVLNPDGTITKATTTTQANASAGQMYTGNTYGLTSQSTSNSNLGKLWTADTNSPLADLFNSDRFASIANGKGDQGYQMNVGDLTDAQKVALGITVGNDYGVKFTDFTQPDWGVQVGQKEKPNVLNDYIMPAVQVIGTVLGAGFGAGGLAAGLAGAGADAAAASSAASGAADYGATGLLGDLSGTGGSITGLGSSVLPDIAATIPIGTATVPITGAASAGSLIGGVGGLGSLADTAAGGTFGGAQLPAGEITDTLGVGGSSLGQQLKNAYDTYSKLKNIYQGFNGLLGSSQQQASDGAGILAQQSQQGSGGTPVSFTQFGQYRNKGLLG